MKRNHSIPFAVFLLLVFLLNTVVGFACAIGLDPYLDHTAHRAAITNQHDHADHHHSDMAHEHDHAHQDHHLAPEAKDNCCKDEVAKLVKDDKLAPVSETLTLQPLAFIALVPVFHQLSISSICLHTPNNKYFVKSYHPPIRDIRISIQSFQI